MAKKTKTGNKNKIIAILITLTFFLGILLTGKGFTGMYLIDFEQKYCSSDADCLAGQACCYFYKENSGVCDQENNCKAIEQITKEEKEKVSSVLDLEADYKFTEEEKLKVTKQISSHLEKPMVKSNYASLIVGEILLILGLIWVIYLKRSDKK